MAYTQPVLNGVTLAHPSEYSERAVYLGSRTQLANGQLRTHLVNNSLKRIFVLRWAALTDAQKTAIQTAFDTTLKNSVSFTSPNGGSFTVVLDPSQAEIAFESFRPAGGNTFRWRATLVLREA